MSDDIDQSLKDALAYKYPPRSVPHEPQWYRDRQQLIHKMQRDCWFHAPEFKKHPREPPRLALAARLALLAVAVGPLWFAPGEATKAAAYMKMTLQEFFNAYLTVDYWCDAEKGDTDVLSPAWDTSAFWKKRGALALLAGERDHRGRRASWADGLIEGPCRLLTPTGCRLPFKVRPHECRVVYDCDQEANWKALRPALVPLWQKDSSELVQLKIGGR